MNKPLWGSLISLTIVAWLPLSSFATEGTHTPRVNAREHRQHERIAEGVKSGELTKGEAHSLRDEQKSIREEKRAYKADGKITAAERKDLRQDQNAASRHIYQEKHDPETR